ncbi:MAG: superoxide dismutase, Ni [Thermoplasmata archaeon]
MENGKEKVMRILDRVLPAETAYAHCDIPCGIYDPHLAQLAAHTVIRMVNLIEELTGKTGKDLNPDELQHYVHDIGRYTEIKEKHAEICKHEIRILWGDYFNHDHVDKFPNLHDLVWQTMKLGSKAKQNVDLQAAENLLETVNKIAEIFWKTKDVETVRVESFYPTKREMVYPRTQ